MLKKVFRLSKNKDFQQVLKSGTKIRTVFGSLIFSYCDEYSIDKSHGKVLLGIVVSKKHGNAVKRNKLKRWLRASFYKTLIKQLESLKTGNENPLCIVFILYKTPQNFWSIYNDIKEAVLTLNKLIME